MKTWLYSIAFAFAIIFIGTGIGIAIIQLGSRGMALVIPFVLTVIVCRVLLFKEEV